MAWRRPDRWRALASLCVAPLVFSAYPLYLGIQRGDAFAFARSQGFWNRHVSPAGPLGGIWDGLRASWAGVEQLVSGSHTHVYWTPVERHRTRCGRLRSTSSASRSSFSSSR
jgi:hypothetical protein